MAFYDEDFGTNKDLESNINVMKGIQDASLLGQKNSVNDREYGTYFWCTD